MTNVDVIIDLSRQLEAVAERIRELAEGISAVHDANPAVCENYETFLLDEVGHVQILALDLTQVVTEGEAENGDDAFGPGELTSELGEKETDTPPEEEEKR